MPGMDLQIGDPSLKFAEDIFGNKRYLHPWQYMVDFEFVYKDGTLDDIILYRYKYKEFKEIEVQNPNA